MDTEDGRHGAIEAARLRAELTVQDLWLRYVALGGSGDAFDIDGYLQELVGLDRFERDVLAQAVNEALEERYRAARVPLSSGLPDQSEAERLRRIVDELLGQKARAREDEGPPRAGH